MKIKYKNYIRKYRIWKGVYQSELAYQTNISKSYIRLIELNKVSPSLRFRLNLCEFFGLSHNQLFYKDK